MDEQQFRKIMIQVRALAKSQDETISKEQVHGKFLPLNVDEDKFVFIFRYLEEEKVKLFDTETERLANIKDNKLADNAETEDDKAINSLMLSADNDDSEYLKQYIDELNSLELPNKEERSKVIEEILNKRELAAELLPNLYLREVVDVARLYTGQGVALEDLIGEGNIGILMGIKMLDCCETVEEVDEFVMKMIMDSMESLIMDRVSDDDFDVKILDRINDLNEKAKDIAEDLERKVTVEELAKELSLEEDYIRETILLSGNAISYIEGCKDE